MASNRITYGANSLVGSKVARVAQLGAQFRTAVLELHLELETYNDANAQLEADAGMTAGQGANLRGMLNFATAELTGQTINDIPANSQTTTRQLIDQTA